MDPPSHEVERSWETVEFLVLRRNSLHSLRLRLLVISCELTSELTSDLTSEVYNKA